MKDYEGDGISKEVFAKSNSAFRPVVLPSGSEWAHLLPCTQSILEYPT